jgi:hypothetical protein
LYCGNANTTFSFKQGKQGKLSSNTESSDKWKKKRIPSQKFDAFGSSVYSGPGANGDFEGAADNIGKAMSPSNNASEDGASFLLIGTNSVNNLDRSNHVSIDITKRKKARVPVLSSNQNQGTGAGMLLVEKYLPHSLSFNYFSEQRKRIPSPLVLDTITMSSDKAVETVDSIATLRPPQAIVDPEQQARKKHRRPQPVIGTSSTQILDRSPTYATLSIEGQVTDLPDGYHSKRIREKATHDTTGKSLRSIVPVAVGEDKTFGQSMSNSIYSERKRKRTPSIMISKGPPQTSRAVSNADSNKDDKIAESNVTLRTSQSSTQALEQQWRKRHRTPQRVQGTGSEQILCRSPTYVDLSDEGPAIDLPNSFHSKRMRQRVSSNIKHDTTSLTQTTLSSGSDVVGELDPSPSMGSVYGERKRMRIPTVSYFSDNYDLAREEPDGPREQENSTNSSRRARETTSQIEYKGDKMNLLLCAVVIVATIIVPLAFLQLNKEYKACKIANDNLKKENRTFKESNKKLKNSIERLRHELDKVANKTSEQVNLLKLLNAAQKEETEQLHVHNEALKNEVVRLTDKLEYVLS